MAASPIPENYHALTPYIIVNDCLAALDFYRNAFDAVETLRMPSPDGSKIYHAEMRIGDSHFMLADEFPEMGFTSPKHVGGTTSSILIYTEDVDAMFQTALSAGATEVKPVEDQFYGDRMGWLLDPFGHKWSIATHKEDLTPEEIDKRFRDMMASGEDKDC